MIQLQIHIEVVKADKKLCVQLHRLEDKDANESERVMANAIQEYQEIVFQQIAETVQNVRAEIQKGNIDA